MGVYINSLNKIKKRLGINPDGPVQAFITNTCYKAMDKYVPYRPGNVGGHLRDEVTLTNTSVTYNMEYASYQYYGKRKDGSHKVRHYTTPGTGRRWDRRMWSVEKDKILQDIKKEVGGK